MKRSHQTALAQCLIANPSMGGEKQSWRQEQEHRKKSETKNTKNTRVTLGVNRDPGLKFRCSYKNYPMFTISFPLDTPCLHIMEQQTTKPSGKAGVKDTKRQPRRRENITGYNSVRSGKKPTQKLQGPRIRGLS